MSTRLSDAAQNHTYLPHPISCGYLAGHKLQALQHLDLGTMNETRNLLCIHQGPPFPC